MKLHLMLEERFFPELLYPLCKTESICMRRDAFSSAAIPAVVSTGCLSGSDTETSSTGVP